MSYPQARLPKQTTVPRGRSQGLWRTTPENYGSGHGDGTFYDSQDFKKALTIASVNTASDGWFLSEAGTTGATSEDLSTTTNSDGVLQVSGTTGTDLQGVQASAGETATQGENIVLPSHASDPKGDVVCEGRFYLNDQANDTFFIGLAEPSGAANTLLLNDNTLSLALDYIGFYRIDGGAINFVVRNDNDGGTAVSESHEIISAANSTEDDWASLGFRVNADKSVEIWVDGTRVKVDTSGTKIAVSDTALPIENLTRVFAACRGATNDNAAVSLQADFFDCYVRE